MAATWILLLIIPQSASVGTPNTAMRAVAENDFASTEEGQSVTLTWSIRPCPGYGTLVISYTGQYRTKRPHMVITYSFKSLQWTRSRSYTDSVHGEKLRTTEYGVRLESPGYSDEGWYLCQYTAGSHTTPEVGIYLHINKDKTEAPKITWSITGNSLQMTCDPQLHRHQGSDRLKMSVTWYRNGTQIHGATSRQSTEHDVRDGVLYLSDAGSRDVGLFYQCDVYYVDANVTSNKSEPYFIEVPVSHNVTWSVLSTLLFLTLLGLGSTLVYKRWGSRICRHTENKVSPDTRATKIETSVKTTTTEVHQESIIKTNQNSTSNLYANTTPNTGVIYENEPSTTARHGQMGKEADAVYMDMDGSTGMYKESVYVQAS